RRCGAGGLAIAGLFLWWWAALMTPLLVILTLFVLVAPLWVLYRSRLSAADHVFRLFGLNPAEYELVGYDLGNRPRKLFLRADGLVGVPDAVFRHRTDGHVVIGEFKSRSYRGRITDYERFQMTLYEGVAQRRYRRPARGLFAFGSGGVVEHSFDPDTYARLLPLADDLRAMQGRQRGSRHRLSAAR
ncbi:MAG TPA: hypothetical protein PLV87_11935, partial [Opitutaceae bacterium]|nr:hypothetical protein [Opitutaceae bacterium]